MGRANVAAYVGSLAHAMVADEPLPEADGRIAYDATTPTERAAQIQATSIAKVARKLLVDRGWGILAREQELRSNDLTGHLDLRAWHSDHGEAIIDLKTGQIGTAWLPGGRVHNANAVGFGLGRRAARSPRPHRQGNKRHAGIPGSGQPLNNRAWCG